MTAQQTVQPHSDDAHHEPVLPQQGPPHRPRHRVLTLLIVVLLIAIPAGYVVLSAYQSRDSGEDKQRIAAASGLTYSQPSKVQQSIYDVPVPADGKRIAYYETNSWKTSRLYVQFRTTEKHLDEFLGTIGTDRSALQDGKVTISREHADMVGWNLHQSGHSYWGTHHDQAGRQPDLDITVDTSYKGQPRVYVVSTAHP
ncbi:hypothetical protein [Streptomyces sp. ODS28]|uniref:hypothetical protein n=1 Tax=Streptomyces sp. ODS28 TaxID=3136688 RepID=UPI0031E6FB9F